jgi:hypothetical protein
MLAIAAVDAIQSRLGVRCRVLDLFERPTVRLMAELLGSAASAPRPSDQSPKPGA